jgi:hypothetical protein
MLTTGRAVDVADGDLVVESIRLASVKTVLGGLL